LLPIHAAIQPETAKNPIIVLNLIAPRVFYFPPPILSPNKSFAAVGKHLGAVLPPIGERAIVFTGIVPRRFQATGDTTEHDGFGYHGLSHLLVGNKEFWAGPFSTSDRSFVRALQHAFRAIIRD
jgi:hypothetical protein